METLKIQWLKPHPEYAYFRGDNANLDPESVEKLTNSGHVVLFPGVDEKEENTLPEDMPLREILWNNGYKSLSQISEAGDLITQLKGIGKKSSELILEFVKNQSV